MDEDKLTVEEFASPLTLTIEQDTCSLMIHWKHSAIMLVKQFASKEDLLTTFLNGDFTKLVDTRDLLDMTLSDAPEFYRWLTQFDRTRILEWINAIYFFDSKHVESLTPSQRLRVYLAFSRNPFTAEAREQECSAYLTTMRKHEGAATTQNKYFMESLHNAKLPRTQANFEAACRTVNERGICIPRETMARFQTSRELMMWLLREVITEDRYIKSCAFCGRYFIPRRNTKQYCSTACANRQRNLDAFCGEKEVGAAYKRIVVNLTTKDKKQNELRRQYCLEGGAVISPRVVLRKFYEENYLQQERFRGAWEKLNKAEEKSWELRQAYEQAKTNYLEWLAEQLIFAKQIHIDNESYWDGEV